MNEYAVWIEVIDEERGIGRQWILPLSAVDHLADEEVKYFRAAQLDQRKREFISRSIFEFVMEEQA